MGRVLGASGPLWQLKLDQRDRSLLIPNTFVEVPCVRRVPRTCVQAFIKRVLPQQFLPFPSRLNAQPQAFQTYSLGARSETICHKGGWLLSCTAWNMLLSSVSKNDTCSEEINGDDSLPHKLWCLCKIDELSANFGLSKDAKHWIVPWTWLTIVKVIFIWFCAFWLMGSWIIPAAAHCLGCSRGTLTYRGQALYSLITDIAEGTVGLGIMHLCLAQFHPLSRDWFPMRWQGQWYIDVLLGCLMFPIVNQLSKINLDLVPLPSQMASSYEQSIMKQDPVASVLHIAVVSICCPIWEEVIFRGFLLPSLTRYLPVWASVLVSAIVFGLAHFNMQRMLPLTFLGLIMGIMFVRSRNLLSSMFLHSLWNGFVFIGLQ